MGARSKSSGTGGEAEIIAIIACPNCSAKLMPLPVSYPLYDVQCTSCLFRAQVKTNRCPPRDQVFGSGWDIMAKNTRAGHLIPPLIVNFKWKQGRRNRQQVIFFPFLSRRNLRKRTRGPSGKRPGYVEFNYVGLLDEKVPKALLLKR